MEGFDEALEREIWQRVRGQGEQMSWQTLAEQEQVGAAVLEQLARQFRGRERALLLEIARKERLHGQLLTGLWGESFEKNSQRLRGSMDVRGVLWALAEQMRSRAQIYRHNADTSPVGRRLAQMARQEESRRSAILRLRGTLGRNTGYKR